jgi:hypothetical protein
MALKLVWRIIKCPKKGHGVVCVEVDQRIASRKSDIIDVYREKSRPKT